MEKNLLRFLVFIFILSSNCFSEINKKQKKVIESQLFLLHEGMLTEKQLFEKAKMFDTTGVFGIGADRMKEREFKKFLEDQE